MTVDLPKGWRAQPAEADRLEARPTASPELGPHGGDQRQSVRRGPIRVRRCCSGDYEALGAGRRTRRWRRAGGQVRDPDHVRQGRGHLRRCARRAGEHARALRAQRVHARPGIAAQPAPGRRGESRGALGAGGRGPARGARRRAPDSLPPPSARPDRSWRPTRWPRTHDRAARRFAALAGGEPVVKAARQTADAYRDARQLGAQRQPDQLDRGASGRTRRRGAARRGDRRRASRGGRLRPTTRPTRRKVGPVRSTPELIDALGDPAELAARVQERLRARGVSLRRELRRAVRASIRCRALLTAAEWSELQVGVAQRIRALDAFVADVYGEQRALAGGSRSPRAVVESSPHYEPAMAGRVGAALDRVRRPRHRALPRRPLPRDRGPGAHGIRLAYAVVAREVLRDLLPVEPPAKRPRARVRASWRWRSTTRRRSPSRSVVLLSGGPERRCLVGALAAGARAVRPGGDVDGPRAARRALVAWLDGRPRAVDVVYQRTERGPLQRQPARVADRAVRARDAAVVNAPGAGVADDKLVHPTSTTWCASTSSEEPLLPSVRSRPAGDVDDLEGFVVKPRGEMGGAGRGDLARCRRGATRRRLREAIEREPEGSSSRRSW